jgi:hypothetical protein
MRVGKGLIMNEYDVWHVRRKVPKALEVETARVMGVPKRYAALGFSVPIERRSGG